MMARLAYKENFVQQIGEFKLHNKTQSDKIISCSVGYYYDYGLGKWVFDFNEAGPVYGPNGEWELDPDNDQCEPYNYGRPVFSTCKNNCPGGEFYQSSDLSYFLIITNISRQTECFSSDEKI